MDDDDWSDYPADDKGAKDGAAHDWFGNGSTTRRTAGVAGAAAGVAGFWTMFKRRDAAPGTADAASAAPATAMNAVQPPVGQPETLWHYVVAGQSLGPERENVLRERLARRELSEETLVWNPQLSNWCSARAAGLMLQAVVQPLPPLLAKPVAAMLWHYVSAGQPTGPVSEDDLRAMLARGALNPSTLVWNSTLANWCSATDAGLTAPNAAAQCSRCHAVLEAGARFCVGCGEPVVAAAPVPRARTCPRCAALLEPENRFCTGCGLALS